MFTRLIITHKNCVDGCACRAIFEKNYGSSAHYLEIDHSDYSDAFAERKEAFQKEVNSFENKEVIMADICLPFEWLRSILEKNNKLVILDHHHTAKPFVKSIVEYATENNLEDKLFINFSFDNTQSGAMLSWKYMYPEKTPPLFIQLVSDGDLWRFNLEGTRGFYTALLNERAPEDIDKSHWIDLLTNEDQVRDYIAKGTPIFAEFMQTVYEYTQKAEPVILEGYSGYMVEAPDKYRSEIGNILAQKNNTFGLCVTQQDTYVSCSLRSVAPFRVDNIAQTFGGGGHQQAAAFRVKNMKELHNILRDRGRKNKI